MDNETPGSRWWLFFAPVGVIAVWLLVGLVLPTCLHAEGNGRGTFGDQFGAVNALFSGLAFGGVIIALWLQQRELRIAIKEQRDAARQHARVVKTQIILDLLDEIRSHEWGAAHAGIWRWRRSKGNGFVDAFIAERSDEPNKCDIDNYRRTFLKPARKVWSLRLAGVINDDFAREIISSDIAETLFLVIEPMEMRMLTDRGKPTQVPFFDFIHRLYPGSARAQPTVPRSAP